MLRDNRWIIIIIGTEHTLIKYFYNYTLDGRVSGARNDKTYDIYTLPRVMYEIMHAVT